MGSSSKKCKDKEGRKRRHRSKSPTDEVPKEKRHRHHKKHHKEKRRHRHHEYESDDSDVVEVVYQEEVAKPETPPPPPSYEKPSEPQSGKSSESLSIEETNKLRAKLGLKPLQDTKGNNQSASDGKKKDDLGEFYHKPADNLAQKAQQEKIRRRLAEHKEKRILDQKLSKVKSLGAADIEEDTSLWVSKSRKIENAKKEADRQAKLLEELDAQFGIGEVIESEQRERRIHQYTDKNLEGFKVEHDVDTFTEGKSVILTLKDKAVLDEEEDVLVNVNMLDDERYKKSNENKKIKTLYNAYDDDEFDQFGNYKEKSLLGKYDEEIEGQQRESFRLGHDNTAERRQASVQSVKEKLSTKRLESLTLPDFTLASEYYSEQEMAKFKKPKKKVRKMRAKGKLLTADDLEASNVGIENVGTRRPKIKDDGKYNIDDIPEVKIDPNSLKIEEDEDDFQRALHKARMLKQKEKVAIDILSIANIKPEPVEEPNADTGNIILNSTAEFCRTLGDIPTYGKAGNREETEDLVDFDKDVAKSEWEDEDDDCIMIEEEGGRWNSVESGTNAEPDAIKTEVPILDEEPDVGSGVAAALKLAMSKGYLDKEQNNKPSNSRLAYLQAKHYSIEDKSYGDEQERGGRRERYAGPVQDFKEKDGFKPNVKLEYIDDEGHVLNSKEAFRYLSHKFHGKGPGKNKIEKRLKKVTQEGLMKKMSSTDTPLGTLNMLQAKQKEMQSPYIVLSGSKHTHSTVISKARR